MSQDEDNGWRSEKYRLGITCKLEEALRESGRMPFITSTYIENLIFEDASNKEEYLNYVAKWIVQLRAPPQPVTPEVSSYLPNILQLAIPQRNISPGAVPRETISNIATTENILQPAALECLPQTAVSSIVSPKSIHERLAQKRNREIEIRRSPDRVKKKKPKKLDWRSPEFRQKMILKLDDAMERSGETRNITSADIEDLIFKKATTKDEYLDNVAKWILRIAGR